MKRIMVTGFPHCGTTILRAKIGECRNVYEDVREDRFPQPETKIGAWKGRYPFVVWKDPVLPLPLLMNGWEHLEHMPSYRDNIMIVIIRNPYYALSSLVDGWFMNPYKTENEMLSSYEKTAAIWLKFKENPHRFPNVFPINYEEMFENNYEVLKTTFRKIGLEFSDDIFENKTKDYELMTYKGRAVVREEQINKPFVNNNGMKPVRLSYFIMNNLNRNLLIQNKLGYKNPLK